MTDVQIQSVKIAQPITCKCGHSIRQGDIRGLGDRVEVVLEIECLVPEGAEQWD